jgi:hypothetical protein
MFHAWNSSDHPSPARGPHDSPINPLQQALHAAAKNGNAPLVEYLINQGFRVDSSACYYFLRPPPGSYFDSSLSRQSKERTNRFTDRPLYMNVYRNCGGRLVRQLD